MAIKINISCPACKKRYALEIPNEAGVHTIHCPFCSAPYEVTVNQPVKPAKKQNAPSEPADVAAKVRRCEVVSGVAWLLIGVVQCVLLYTAAAGVWNIINAIVSLRNVKNISVGNAAVVPYFEGRKVWLIVAAVVNIILGGVVGVFLVAFEWYVRDYVLRNRYVFEK